MANVCVITGGGSGMGLETARNIDKDVILVLTGRTAAKLENAKAILESEGHEVHVTACDVSVRRDVHELCLLASSLGTIKTVIHAAGVIVDIASSSAYEAPAVLVKHQIYEEAEYEEEKFIKHMTGEAKMIPGSDYNKSGMAYVMSKNFVVWYAQKCAHEYAAKGIRVVSVSPGLIETDMGAREVEQADFAKQMIEQTCAHRMGTPEELGFAIASIADERNGYLCGIDVLIDGGASTGKKFGK